MADIEGPAAQTFTAFNAGVLQDVLLYLGPRDIQVAAGKVAAWRDSSGGRFFDQAAAGEVTFEGTSGSIAQTFFQFHPKGLPGVKIYLGPGDWALSESRVTTWRDRAVGTPALFTQAAEGELSVSAEIAQSFPAFTQSAAGWRDVDGEAAQTFPAFEQAANGLLPLIVQTFPGFAQAATGVVFITPRPSVIRGARVGTKRVLRLYLGTALLRDFDVGSGLFDADGNPLRLELADGTPVRVELV